MDATTVAAIYAATVATGALAIQAAQWYSARTRLKIKANAGVAPILSGELDRLGNGTSQPGEVLFIEVINRSDYVVKIAHVGLQTVGRKDQKGLAFARPYPLSLRLPFEIPARDSVMLWQPRSRLEPWEPRRLRVHIQTAAGNSFQSRRFRMHDLVRLEIVS